MNFKKTSKKKNESAIKFVNLQSTGKWAIQPFKSMMKKAFSVNHGMHGHETSECKGMPQRPKSDTQAKTTPQKCHLYGLGDHLMLNCPRLMKCLDKEKLGMFKQNQC